MISEIYKNRILYYNFMQNVLQQRISLEEFQSIYWKQRDKDIDHNSITGYSDYYLNRVLIGNEKMFEEKYVNPLYEEGSAGLKNYEQGAKELDIKGEIFFMGILDFIDDYVREYYPSDNEGFDPSSDIDEQTLIKILQIAFDVLERNKDRWENNLDEIIKI